MKKNKGFTLIELLVVIVILGILAATAMPKYMDYRKEARMAALFAAAGNMQDSLSMAEAAFYMQLAKPTADINSGTGQQRCEYVAITTADGSIVNVGSGDQTCAGALPYAKGKLTFGGMARMMGCPANWNPDNNPACNGFNIARYPVGNLGSLTIRVTMDGYDNCYIQYNSTTGIIAQQINTAVC